MLTDPGKDDAFCGLWEHVMLNSICYKENFTDCSSMDKEMTEHGDGWAGTSR